MWLNYRALLVLVLVLFGSASYDKNVIPLPLYVGESRWNEASLLAFDFHQVWGHHFSFLV